MRKTLTLDGEVAAKLQSLARERQISFQAAVNDVLRRGLAGGWNTRHAFLVDARSLGLRSSADLHRPLTLAGEFEDEEIVRKVVRRP